MKCQNCEKRAYYAYENNEKDIRCLKHKEKNMVNIMNKEYSGKRFRKNIENQGGKVLGEYKRNSVPVPCECKEGHECNPLPASIQKGKGMCRICAGNDFETAKQNFHKNIENQGGTVKGEYKGALVPVPCECKEGHECNPSPASIQQGGGMCKICVGNDFKTAKQNFHKNVENQGGKVKGEYKGASVPVPCECKYGHECNPIPSSVQQGGGICAKCNFSKLENIFKKICEKLSISYETQKKFLECKNKRTLPFDYFLKYISKNILVELQGEQHFSHITHYHKNINKFIDRLNKDAIKSAFAFNSNHNFLCVSYLCEKNIEKVLKNYLEDLSERKEPLIRFYITSEIFIDFNMETNIKTDYENIHHIFQHNLKYLSSPKTLTENDVEVCPYCEEIFLKEYIVKHYEGENHYQMLKEIWGDELVGRDPETGVPIVHEKE